MRGPEAMALEEDIPELKPLNVTRRQLLLYKLRRIHISRAKEHRDGLLADKVLDGGTLVKSKKLFELGDMVIVVPAANETKRQIFSIEQKIEELVQVFTDEWCKDFDDGADFRKCQNFLEEDNSLLIGCSTDVDLSTLAKAKRMGRLDHYDVSGRALPVHTQSHCSGSRQHLHIPGDMQFRGYEPPESERIRASQGSQSRQCQGVQGDFAHPEGIEVSTRPGHSQHCDGKSRQWNQEPRDLQRGWHAWHLRH